EGERVASKNADLAGERSLSFEAGEITEIDGKTKHQLRVLVSLSGEGRWMISPTASGPDKNIRWQRPETGVPLAERPQDARIIHFAGPLTFALSVMEDRKVERLQRGKENDLYVVVGTPVCGDGWRTFARTWVNVSGSVVPTPEVELPNKEPGGRSIKVRPKLYRCECGGGFWMQFKIPPEVGEGMARITLSFPDWPDGRVESRTFEIEMSK